MRKLFTILALAVLAIPNTFAAIGWAGNLTPTHSVTGTGASTTTNISFQVWKTGVTDSPGQGAGITCEVYWQGEMNWTPPAIVPMTYSTDSGNDDIYTATITLQDNLTYEYTARCSDDGGANWYWNGGNQQVTVSGLPITLTALTNQVNGNDAAINWTVATENNITHYEVEQNVNNTWKVVANVAAANLGAYTASVKGLNAGLHNFRLVAVEKDGSRNVYGNTTVLVEVPGSHVVNSAYPNPFAASATVEFAVAKAQSVTVEVYNTLGQKVATVFEGAVDANNTKAVRISAQGLHNGTYFVRISGETFSETQRISVVK